MATRKPFNADGDNIAAAIPHNERKGACFADGCRLPGTITTGGNTWSCGWHHAALPSDIPRITRTMQDWSGVVSEINAARRALIGEFASDPRALNQLFTEAVNRLRPSVMGGGWKDQFERQGTEDYRSWLLRLEGFLHVRIAESTSTHHRKAA